MTYEQTCEYLFAKTPSFEKSGKTGFREGMANTLALDSHFGHPHRHFKTIHVAGTNGKGSVSHTLAAQLQAAGLRTGLYTSPHLVDFRERIRVDGEMIPKDYVTHFVESERSFFEPLGPSFFELTTALAFKYFKERQVDVAVVEVGLGGRLDCTNVVSPILSVITNISLDHTDMLGNTLGQIAREKAGIIKDGTPVVIGENHEETRCVFENVAGERHAPIVFAEDEPLIASATPVAGGMHYTTSDGRQFDGELGGIYQAKNTNTAMHALRWLVEMKMLKAIDLDAFKDIGKRTGLMGRWQKVGSDPTVVCDTGHNTGGWAYISRQLSMVDCRHMHIVFGMVSDKDIDGVMDMLPKKASYHFTKAPTKRAIPEDVLLQAGRRHGLDGTCHPSVAEAYGAARRQASPSDFIFVGGSTYIVAEFMKTCI